MDSAPRFEYIFKSGITCLYGASDFIILDGEGFFNGYKFSKGMADVFYVPLYSIPLTIECDNDLHVSFGKITLTTCEQNYYRCPKTKYRAICPWLFISHNPQQYFPENLIQFVQQLSIPSILLVLGCKNVGKSTFCRYAVNTLLNKFPSVAFIDLDVGQPEFAFPTTLSKHVVTTPMIRTPEHALRHDPQSYRPPLLESLFIGELSYGANQSFEPLVSSIKRDEMTVINCCGYFQGPGIQLHERIIKAFQPDHIVLLTKQDVNCPPTIKPTIIGLVEHIPSPGNINPVAHRALRFTVACSCEPQRVPMSRFRFATTVNKIPYEALFEAMNASLVALLVDQRPFEPTDKIAIVRTIPPNIRCLGYAFVRAIDLANRELLLQTDIDFSTANLLVYTGLDTPPDLLKESNRAIMNYVPFTTNWNI